MPPRKKPGHPAKPTLTIGAGALVAGALYLLVYFWRTYPREVCAVGEVLCRQHLPAAPPPVVTVAPIPDEPLDGQVQARDGACPSGYRAINQGCWFEGRNPPPCPLGTYEFERRCWAPYVPAKRLPAVQQPWNRR